MSSSPKVFISYGAGFTPIKDFFVRVLQDLGFETDVFDEAHEKPHEEVELERIKKCDGVVVLLTPDRQLGDGSYMASEFVQRECGLAKGAGKERLFFSIDQGKLSAQQDSEGTTANVKSVETESGELAFTLADTQKIIKSLVGFKERLVDEGGERSDYIRYESFEIHQHIRSSEELVIHNKVRAVALEDFDSHTHDARLFCDRKGGSKDGIEIDRDNLELQIIRPRERHPQYIFTERSRSGFRFDFEFPHTITKDSPIEYEYRRRHANFFPYTREELDAVIKEERLTKKIMVDERMIGQDFFVTQPTESLSIFMRFPKGYKIPKSDCTALAVYHRGGQLHHRETNRAREHFDIEHDKFDDVCTLWLKLEKPAAGCTYYLLYRPPSEASLNR